MGIIATIKMLTSEEGIEIGEEQNRYKVVTRMLQSKKFSISEIANFADVSEDFVQKVQEDLK